MADMINPYSNPYLPAFVSQRPRVTNTIPGPTSVGCVYSQIHPVNGFEGARAYNLAAGSSEILAEADPNIARVYIVACDANGQKFVEGYRLIKEEEPKPTTMEDLNAKLNELLGRMNKLEERESADDQSYHGPARKGQWKPNNAGGQSNGRDDAGSAKPAGNPAAADSQ